MPLGLSRYFPITNPTLIIFVVLVIILSAPLLMRRLKLPHIVGMILAGIIVGEHGLGILTRDSSFELFGNVGLFYIMFLASLEMDMEGLRKNYREGLVFGIITFLIPFAAGFVVGYRLLHFSMLTSLLLACILASHTLVAYPIVGRYGLGRNDCVTIAVFGTTVALLLPLVLLAGISAAAQGDLGWQFWVWLLVKSAVYLFLLFFFYPRLTRWFFKKYSDPIICFVFVMALMLLSAVVSSFIGLEGLLGAYLAGLVLNRYIPLVSPLMNRIEFVGNAIFIPYFLIGVGMLIDLGSLFRNGSGWLSIIAIVCIAILSKWVAAWVAQKVLRRTSDERELLFGLSSAHAAGALAMVMVGTRLIVDGHPLMGEDVMNSMFMMILVSCIISSISTEKAAQKIAIREAEAPTPERIASEKIVVALSNSETVGGLIHTAILMRNPKSKETLTALQITIRGPQAERNRKLGRTNLKHASDIAAAADVPLVTQNRVGSSVSNSILHALDENDATELLLGLHHKRRFVDSFFGGITNDILSGTGRQIIIVKYHMPVNVVQRIIVAMPVRAEMEQGFFRWLERLCRMGQQLGCRIDFHGHPDTQPVLEEYIHNFHDRLRYVFAPLEDWNGLLVVTQKLDFDHLFVLVSARRGSLSWQPSFDNIPSQLMKYFSDNNLMIIYPEQHHTDDLSFTDPFKQI